MHIPLFNRLIVQQPSVPLSLNLPQRKHDLDGGEKDGKDEEEAAHVQMSHDLHGPVNTGHEAHGVGKHHQQDVYARRPRGKVSKPGQVVELETGATLNVPMFVKLGDIIRINTETGEYVERV